ncbi:hypothetical protein ACFTXM_14660 [Streptomyces sp. NPDC056930]|uniref:hypothetical protein n=1 Tax=Streptomyces sp. NPDC056930 TaxID=3345967 RepID=UPI00363CB431
MHALAHIADNLVPGLSLLADILNPKVIVSGGRFALFGSFVIDKDSALLRG